MRLAFHDCFTYKNADGSFINGCDGCLNPDGMNTNVTKIYNTEKGQLNGPDEGLGANNGLLWTADILEEVYTNKKFPRSAPYLDVSMKESGKSRADLWAFAGLVSVYFGVDLNNKACQGTQDTKCKFNTPICYLLFKTISFYSCLWPHEKG